MYQNLKNIIGIAIICATVAWCFYIGAPLFLGTFLFGYIGKVKKDRIIFGGLLKKLMDTSHLYL